MCERGKLIGILTLEHIPRYLESLSGLFLLPGTLLSTVDGTVSVLHIVNQCRSVRAQIAVSK